MERVTDLNWGSQRRENHVKFHRTVASPLFGDLESHSVRFSYLSSQIKAKDARHNAGSYSIAWQEKAKFHNKTGLALQLKAF